MSRYSCARSRYCSALRDTTPPSRGSGIRATQRKARKFGNKPRIRGKTASNEPATLTFGVAAKFRSGPPRLQRIAASQGDPTAEARCVPIHPDGRSGIMRRRELFRGCYFLDGGKGPPVAERPRICPFDDYAAAFTKPNWPNHRSRRFQSSFNVLLDVPEDRGYRHSIVGVFERHHSRLEGTRRRSAGLAALLHHEPLSLLIAQTELGNGRGFGSPVRQALAHHE